MKLIVSGATGFVGREVIRQSLSRREITSVIALARKPVQAPEKLEDGADPSKLKSVVVEDYGSYSEEVTKEFSGAAGCIWTVAITPSRSKTYDFEEVKRVCQTCTLAGFKAMHQSGLSKPFRFLYMSGARMERDQTKPARFLPEYSHMRGETESKVLSLASELDVEAGIVKPGFITPGSVTAPLDVLRLVVGNVVPWIFGDPSISVVDLARVMLDQVIDGFEQETLEIPDLARLTKAT